MSSARWPTRQRRPRTRSGLGLAFRRPPSPLLRPTEASCCVFLPAAWTAVLGKMGCACPGTGGGCPPDLVFQQRTHAAGDSLGPPGRVTAVRALLRWEARPERRRKGPLCAFPKRNRQTKRKIELKLQGPGIFYVLGIQRELKPDTHAHPRAHPRTHARTHTQPAGKGKSEVRELGARKVGG